MPQRKRQGLSKKQLSQYFSSIGAVGGKKSKRKLTSYEAKKMAEKRWKNL